MRATGWAAVALAMAGAVAFLMHRLWPGGNSSAMALFAAGLVLVIAGSSLGRRIAEAEPRAATARTVAASRPTQQRAS